MNYSQHEIEKYLDRYFNKPGVFLEIGCWNGELISQTAYLEREKGWIGVCVDPFPKDFGKRTCQVCHMAVSLDGQPREFIKVSIDRRYGGDVSYFSGFVDSVQTHLPLIMEHCDYEKITIPTITIAQLFARYKLPDHIDFFSVDTEGSELEIFSGIDFSKYSFGLIVFEHNDQNQIRQDIGKMLAQNGYVLVESLRCDDIYVNKNLI